MSRAHQLFLQKIIPYYDWFRNCLNEITEPPGKCYTNFEIFFRQNIHSISIGFCRKMKNMERSLCPQVLQGLIYIDYFQNLNYRNTCIITIMNLIISNVLIDFSTLCLKRSLISKRTECFIDHLLVTFFFKKSMSNKVRNLVSLC